MKIKELVFLILFSKVDLNFKFCIRLKLNAERRIGYIEKLSYFHE